MYKTSTGVFSGICMGPPAPYYICNYICSLKFGNVRDTVLGVGNYVYIQMCSQASVRDETMVSGFNAASFGATTAVEIQL